MINKMFIGDDVSVEDKSFVKILLNKVAELNGIGVAVFQNHVMDSTDFGGVKYVVIGGKCTFQTFESAEKQGFINPKGLASTRLEYCGYYTTKELEDRYESLRNTKDVSGGAKKQREG
jgi:hypothetical protein